MSRKIEDLYPELAEICHWFLYLCEEKGLKVGLAETFRTKEEQNDLYAQGRTKPGSIITNAKYPYSAHCWGLAFDIYRNDGTGAYNDKDKWFSKCGVIGKQLGLAWGGDFKSIIDKPHFELKRLLPNNSVKQLISVYGTPEEFIKTWKVNEMTEEQIHKIAKEESEKAIADYFATRSDMDISAWAKPYIEKAQEYGISDGKRPRMFATREEVATMIVREIEKGQ